MASAYPVSVSIHMSFTTCCHKGCGIMFGIPDDEHKRLHSSHSTFYCPRGHSQYFSGLSNEEKLKEQIANLERDKQNLIKREEWAKEGEKKATYDAKIARSHAKAAITITRKLRQQIKDGQCPCCDETFKDLAEHMTVKHPTYKGVRKP